MLALAGSVCCYVGIQFTVALTTVLRSSMIKTRMTDIINKIRTISETVNISTAGIKITATANQCERQFNQKMSFLRSVSFSQMIQQ